MSDEPVQQFPIERNHFTQLLILWLVAATFLASGSDTSGVLFVVPSVVSFFILLLLPLYAFALALGNAQSSS